MQPKFLKFVQVCAQVCTHVSAHKPACMCLCTSLHTGVCAQTCIHASVRKSANDWTNFSIVSERDWALQFPWGNYRFSSYRFGTTIKGPMTMHDMSPIIGKIGSAQTAHVRWAVSSSSSSNLRLI